MFRVVVFDFDGTLVDSNDIKERCLYLTVVNLPGGPAALAHAQLAGGNRYRIFSEVARRLNPGGDADAVARRGYQLAMDYGRRCARGIAAAPERRGSRAALAELKRRGLRLYVNSSTPQRDLKGLLRTRSLLSYFDGVAGSPKAKPDNLREILAMERVSPREAVVVGDGEDDLFAARSLGTWFVAVDVEGRIHETVPYTVKDMRLLCPLLDRLAPRPTHPEGGRSVAVGSP